MKSLTIVFTSLFLVGQALAQESFPALTLRPTKTQVFGGVGQTRVAGDKVSESRFVGVASMHLFGDGYLLRPYLAIGEINPNKAGADDYETFQAGLMLGKKVTKSLILLGGGSVTGLFPEGGDEEYRPTLNASVAYTVWESKGKLLQVLTPVSLNWTKQGRGSILLSAGLGLVF